MEVLVWLALICVIHVKMIMDSNVMRMDAKAKLTETLLDFAFVRIINSYLREVALPVTLAIIVVLLRTHVKNVQLLVQLVYLLLKLLLVYQHTSS